MLIPELVAQRAASAPDAVAVCSGTDVLSYGELDSRADQLARQLRAVGVKTGTPVGLCIERSPDFAVGALGIMRAGGAYAPLDPSYPIERLNFVLRDTRAPALVTNGKTPVGLAPSGCRVVVLALGTHKQISTPPDESSSAGRRSEHLAYVIYTSGSTGVPKGVAVTHGNLANLVRWHQRAFQVNPMDRATQLASPAFDAAVWELWPYLSAGASVYLPDDLTRMDPERLRDWLVLQRITIGFVPTPLAEAMLSLAWPNETALRALLTGGDALHRFPPATLPFSVVNNYGPTEATVVTTSGVVPTDGGPRSLPSIGKPIDGVEVHVVDEDLRPVPEGAPGELLIGGAGLSLGYLNHPDLTDEKFIRDPFGEIEGGRLYRTGDMVRRRADGELEFVGRLDDQVKIRGQRVELGEIAGALNRIPSVRSSVVVAADDEGHGRRLVAYVVPTSAQKVVRRELHERLAQSLPAYMVPSEFVLIDEVPVTRNGKVDRAALPNPFSRSNRPGRSGVGPTTQVEEALVVVVAELLGLSTVGTDENFFVLGGHSLLGAQLIARISQMYDVELPLRSVFDGPTVAEMAAAIESLVLAEVAAMTDDEAERLMGAAQVPGEPPLSNPR
ncbi:MAG: non-ribosomal peptide synthetase [Candidatus Dormiibacterota bacterium]